MWLIGAMVCLLAAPWVQLSVSTGNGWPHNALQQYWLMPVSCHFRDLCGAIASVRIFTFTFTLRVKARYWSKIAIFHTFYITTSWENGCECFRAVFFSSQPSQSQIAALSGGVTRFYKNVVCLLTSLTRYRQMDRQTDRQTDGNALSIAERLLRIVRNAH